MNENFEIEHNEFLSIAGVDIVALHNIFGIIAGGFKNQVPTKHQLIIMFNFILFLFRLYGKSLVCLEGPKMTPIKMNPNELILWLKKFYDKGKYEEISYGIWFGLDESAIPKKYLPKPMDDSGA